MALTVLATVGAPQVLVRKLVDGGKYVTTVVGAVPNVIPVVAVPPDMLRLLPDVLRAAENQFVVKVNTVFEVLVTMTST